MENTLFMVRWNGIARLLRVVRPEGPCGVGGNTLIDLVNTNSTNHITYTLSSKYNG